MRLPQNAYPNFTNFQEASFPQEVTPPSVEPDVDTQCVRFNPAWARVLASACSQLTQLSAWKGTAEEKKLAVSRATTLKIILQEFAECDMACCYDIVERRITSDGQIQIRVNGGEWQTDPNDPRVGAPLYSPITMDETHTKCDAATNAATHIDDVITGTSSELGGTGSLIEIAAAVILLLFGIFIAPEALPALVPTILAIVSGLIFLGQAAWDAYFTTDVHAAILCALYCNIGDDGTFTQAQYDAFVAQLVRELPADAVKDMFIQLIARIGLVGINDYAAIGTSTSADCSSCECQTLCDLDNWDVLTGFGDKFGVITSRNPSTGDLTIETTGINTNGLYYIDMSISQNHDAALGCFCNSNEAGTYAVAGEAHSGTFGHSGSMLNHCVNHIQMSAGAPFSITFNFGACP